VSIRDLQVRLDRQLKEGGCRVYTGGAAIADALGTWREIRRDCAAHGEPEDQPFCNWVVTEGVCVFAFYTQEVELFVIRVDEQEFRRDFELLAMAQVRENRELLHRRFGRCSPDLVLDRQFCRAWLACGEFSAW
jgi:hypothetical protein